MSSLLMGTLFVALMIGIVGYQLRESLGQLIGAAIPGWVAMLVAIAVLAAFLLVPAQGVAAFAQ